jgi:Coatomer gamma subunit appendage platform subdomain
VTVTKHTVTAHIVLQFDVVNRGAAAALTAAAGGSSSTSSSSAKRQQQQQRLQRLLNVTVHCEPADAAVCAVHSDVPLAVLMPGAAGSCYTVLEQLHSSTSSSSSSSDAAVSVACELRYTLQGGFAEEYPLEDVEITAADFGYS